jgi:serine/threonine protein phosphatase PrpC
MDHGAFVVLDGVSGQFETGAGKIGSRTAADILHASILDLPPAATLAERQQQAHDLLERAHAAVRSVQREKKIEGAESTVAVALTYREGDQAFLVTDNVGDCRIYRMRRTGQLEPITIDDYLLVWTGGNLNEAQQLQKKLSEVSFASELPETEQTIFVHRNNPGQRLGDRGEIRHNLRVVELHPDDRILLTSDGIHDNLRHSEIESIMREADLPETACSRLIQAATQRSREPWSEQNITRAKPDDMTTVVVEFKP